MQHLVDASKYARKGVTSLVGKTHVQNKTVYFLNEKCYLKISVLSKQADHARQ